MESQSKTCQNCKAQFAIEPEDFAFYEKMQVPPPTWCPECRLIRRSLWRNEHILFRHKDELTGKQIFSEVPPGDPHKIYEHDYWWSDQWDPLDYGRDYDFNRPFFTQFNELFLEVPWYSRNFLELKNSDYCAEASYTKNSYLCFDIDYIEDSAYLVNCGRVKDSFDLLSTFFSELCYESTMVIKSYQTFYSYNCEDCRSVWLSRDCVGCSDCFGCVNLKSKKYHIFNEPYSKEDYFKALEALNLGSYASLQAQIPKARDFWQKFPVKYLSGLRNLASSGDYLNDTKNAQKSFMISNTENSKFIQLVFYKCADSYDYTVWGDGASQMYECLCCGQQVDSLKFCYDCWPSCRNLEYCISCRSSSNLFGCVGLRNKEYCIFNKQYSKDEYFALRARIVEQMKAMPYVDGQGNAYRYGEFFPSEFSHLAYNQSLAQDLFPLSKDEAEKNGHRWQDPDRREYETTTTAGALPDHINDVPDAITKEIIQCATCGRAYRIIEPELIFLKRMGIPLPRTCVDCRLQKRFSQLNQPRLYKRKCQCAGGAFDRGGEYKNVAGHFHAGGACPNEFETSYAPDRPEIVYCEQCYQAEVA
jgi:hypothetical protein